MGYFVGLDVSQKNTAICILDASGEVVWQGSVLTTPSAIRAQVVKHAAETAKIGMETGPLAVWLYHSLRNLGLDIDCIHARHVHAALSVQLNKTDRNDAHGIAQLVRSGWYQAIHVKSLACHEQRLVLIAREKLIRMRTGTINQIRGIVKTFGVVLGPGRNSVFEREVERCMEEVGSLKPVVDTLLMTWRHLNEQIRKLEKQLAKSAEKDPVNRLLMSVPGVGLLTAVSFKTAIDDPGRFARITDIGPFLGLTPKRYQSGEVNRSAGISKHGNRQTRSLLYEAALSLFKRYGKDTKLARWASELEARVGHKKAVVALTRKLATILLSIWKSGEVFRTA